MYLLQQQEKKIIPHLKNKTYIGADLNVGRLKASLYSGLANYEIEEITLSFDQGVVINPQSIIVVPDNARVFPNKIITDINYDGEYVYNTEDFNDDYSLIEED